MLRLVARGKSKKIGKLKVMTSKSLNNLWLFISLTLRFFFSLFLIISLEAGEMVQGIRYSHVTNLWFNFNLYTCPLSITRNAH